MRAVIMLFATCEVPGGATAIIELLTLLTQSSEGNQPSAGLIRAHQLKLSTSNDGNVMMVQKYRYFGPNLFAIAFTFLSSRKASKIRGWL